MKQFEEENGNMDLIREWARSTDDVRAPEGLTHNIMTRISLEPAFIPRGPGVTLGLPFRIISVTVFIILLALTLLTPHINPGIIDSIADRMPDFSTIGPLKLADLSWINGYTHIIYIVSGLFMLLFIDSLLVRLFPGRKG